MRKSNSEFCDRRLQACDGMLELLILVVRSVKLYRAVLLFLVVRDLFGLQRCDGLVKGSGALLEADLLAAERHKDEVELRLGMP